MNKHIRKGLSLLLTLCLIAGMLTIGAAAENTGFPDAEGHWAQDTIEKFAAEGIVKGYPDGLVHPNETISGAEFSALLSRMLGLETVPAEDGISWAAAELAALESAGIIESTEFIPELPIIRMEMIRMLVRAMKAECENDEAFIEKAQELGIVRGFPDGSIHADCTATRAEAFTMLLRQKTAADAAVKPTPTPAVTPSGGGYYTPPVPAAELSFTLPETAYVGESAVVSAIITSAASVTWKLMVNDKETALPEDFKEIGGELSFSEAGTYTLTGTAKNSAGRETTCTCSVKVHPVAALALELPAIAHTDAAVTASLTGELCGLAVEWTLTKNGETASLTDVAEGSLTDAGGEIRFLDRGVYRLTAAVTDELGREFFTSAEIVVYPVGEIGFYLPETFHTDETVSVVTAFDNLDGSAIKWTLEHDGKAVDCMSGSLTADGGSIKITEKGDYVLTASVTDAGGRSYSQSQSFTVYPIPEFSYSIDKTAHTDTELTIKTTAKDIDGLTVEWLLDNNLGIQNWDTYIDGALKNDGGAVRFKHAGTYSFVARVTDATGRVFLFENGVRCVVQPVLDLGFELPAMVHTDTTIEVRTFGNNNVLPIKWALTRNDSAVAVSDYISGDLNAYGGSIRFKTDGEYTLTATATDILGRSFTASASTKVLPLPEITLTIPASAKIGEPITLSLGDSPVNGSDVKWSLTKDGEPSTAYTGSLESDGEISIKEIGSYVLTAVYTDALGREFSKSVVLEIKNTAPNMPTLTVQTTRTAKNGKFLVNVSASATDPDGHAVTYEYSGTSADGYYAVGQHTIKVRAVDSYGAASDWVTKTFSVINSAPTTPVITRNPDGNCVNPGTAVSITASSTDPDGDAVTYVWENRPSASYVYGLGRQVVRVKAVDSTGAESPWAAIIFFVASNSNGGGMTLTGPESTILENGITGATITSLTFTVPPVQGHNGSDFGRVRGFNKNTGVWDQLAYQTTNNGVTLTGNMTHGIYTQLEFYYYTNHNCMYNKSNITYSVDFYFE